MKLSRKILIFAFIVLPVLLVTVFSYLRIKKDAVTRIYEERRSIASLSARVLKEKLDGLNDIGLLFSTGPAIRQHVDAQKWDEAIALMKQVPKDFAYIDRVFITDTAGTLMADVPSSPALKGKNYADRDWYKGLTKNWQPYLSEVYKRANPPYNIVTALALPVKNEAGKIRGILVLQVDIDQLLEWSKEVSIGSLGFEYVVDQKGHIAANPQYAEADSVIDYSSVPAVQKALSGKKNVEILYNPIAKENRLSAFEQVPGYGWAVIVQQESTAALSGNNRMRFLLILYAVIILFALVSAYLIIWEIDRRKKAEVQLKEFKHFFNNNNDLCGIANTIGYFESINTTFSKVLEYAEKEFCETPFIELIHPDDVASTLHEYEKLKSGALVINFINRYRKKDGSYLWLDWNATPNPVTGKLYCIARDITERKKTEEELKQQNIFLDTILDNIPNMLFVKDAKDLRFIRFNLAGEKILGYKGSDLIGKNDYDFFPKEQADFFINKDREVLKNGILQDIKEEKISTANGERWLHTKKIPVNDKNGVSVFIIGISEDITEQKKAQETLQNSLKEVSDYKYALDESAIVAITDPKGIINYVNDNFCKISRYSREELIGQDHRIISSGYHPKEFIRDLWVTIANGKVWRGDLKNRAKDGTYYWVDTTIVPFLNEQGKPYQYVAIRAEITQRKKAEEQLLRVNNELEAFTYSVSHDLRAPLRGIVGFTSILEEDYTSKLDDEAKRITSIIKNNTTKMGLLIDDLLAFSRMGRQEIVKTRIQTAVMVKEVIDGLMLHHKGRPVEWLVHPLPDSIGDINLVRQVWINFISNAVKYSGKKEQPCIEIGSFIQAGQTVFFVKDNGVGFDKQYGDKLFKVFQRLHSADEFEGTGVGLAIVEKIISKHGGKVWAEGEVNKGASFYFSLPAGR